MSNSLSIRQQERFISAFDNLIKSDTIHKKDINTLHNIINKFDKIEPGIELMARMGSCGKNPRAMQETFTQLFSKLESQSAGTHKDKQAKLESIQQKLSPIVKDIHSTEIKRQIGTIDAAIQEVSETITDKKKDVRHCEKDITRTSTAIKKLQREIQSLETGPDSACATQDKQEIDAKKSEVLSLEKQNAVKSLQLRTARQSITKNEIHKENLLEQRVSLSSQL